MKRSRLFLWIFGILMQAFLISMHFYQRNMEAMYAETEYLLKEVLNEELHRRQQELNLFYISKVTIDTIPLTIRVTGEFYQFNLSSCIRQQNSLTAQFVSF
ncbi:hypothetical protein AAH020_12685, partial [Bacteroides fragilis]